MKARATIPGRCRDRHWLLAQPWYVVIGPSGAGKTTALLNAGLRVVAMNQSGVTGNLRETQTCDWWLAETAVLIEAADGATTHDPDKAPGAWESLPTLLRRRRAGTALSGVLVVISLADPALGDAAARSRLGETIRQRLIELGGRPPVYLIFTKADLVAGFSEFFDDLDSAGRAQVWGTTFPLRAAAPDAAFDAAFDGLAARLDARLVARLTVERGIDRRVAIAGFPAQFATLRAPLGEFIGALCAAREGAAAPWLRGVYFTSATQEGAPADRLESTLARRFGLAPRTMAAPRPGQGRAYFLADLFGDLIVGEALLADAPGDGARPRTWLKRGVLAATLVFAIGTGVLLLAVHSADIRAIAALDRGLAGYEREAARLPLTSVSEADLPLFVGLLDRARDMAAGRDGGAGATGLPGLDTTPALTTAAQAIYRRALVRVLLPRLLWRLESQIRGNLGQLNFLYEAMRVYLMLGGAGPLDPGLIQGWMTLDWRLAYPGPAQAADRAALAQHLAALLAAPLPLISLDADLVREARAALSRMPLASLAYTRLRASRAARDMPSWQPIEVLGPVGVALFDRASGKPLSDGVPGFFTPDGYARVLLPALDAAIRSAADEAWVLGKTADADAAETAQLRQAVTALYAADYVSAWEAMLGDLQLVPFADLAQAAQDLFVIASPESPLRRLLVAVAQGVSVPLPAVDAHFAALREVAGVGGAAPIDGVLHGLIGLQQQLARMAATGQAAPGGADPSLAVRLLALRQPPPLSRWLSALAESGGALRSGNVRQQAIASWNAGGGPGPLCRLATEGREPFTAGSTADLPLADFERLFAPGGVLDSFFQTHLAGFVDRTGPVWRPRASQGQAAPLAAIDAIQFQRAAAIRNGFFASGPTPSLRFTVIPLEGPASLDLGGVAVGGAGGLRPVEVTWPGSPPMDLARLRLGNADIVRETGPWAAWRLLSRFSRLPAGGELRGAMPADRVSYRLPDGRPAVFSFRTAVQPNPLLGGLFAGFRCPDVHEVRE